MTPAEQQKALLPRQGLLREITDQTVIDEVIERGRITRAELADVTGISKPTISGAVRRLEDRGLLHTTGTRTGHRGRVATYYELAPTAGWVLSLDVGADGVRTRSADLGGTVFDDHRHPPVATGDVAAMVRRIRVAVRRSLRVGTAAHGDLRAVALSMANAVDPVTSQVLALPNTAFPEGLVDPAAIFADLVSAPLLVDNDINCAALAEHRSGAARGEDDFAYVNVGAGFGMGLYANGRMVRGAHGLAGEIGYLATATGPAQYSTLVAALGMQGFGAPDSSAMDVTTIRKSLDAQRNVDRAANKAARTLGTAIGQIIVATCAVVDPDLVLLGGPLGRQPMLVDTARRTVADLFPSPVRIELGDLGEAASLQGALHLALDHARRHLLTPSA
jgi:predicted NBD/HSP70 family sugar kinase